MEPPSRDGNRRTDRAVHPSYKGNLEQCARGTSNVAPVSLKATTEKRMAAVVERVGSRFMFPGTSVTVDRMGYGAMRLTGPGVWGPPDDRSAAVAVLREAVALGVDHIDTSDFYGPHVTNRIIREALHPYPPGLAIVTKVGFRRGDDKSWIAAQSRDELTNAVHDNLRNLGVDALDIVNLRVGGAHGPSETSIVDPLIVLVDLKREGLIRNIGLSNVTPRQFEEARQATEIVCVQNQYNLVQRGDDGFIDELRNRGVAYVPFFPLGGFSPLQSSVLDDVAMLVDAKPMQVALAWLMQRSPNILLIPGTSSVEHLRENVRAGELVLPGEAIARLDGMC
jgi:pyridoxine 4-dehydrogenase